MSPLGERGREILLTAMCSWDPCFARIRWGIVGCRLDVAVRPSPPYRDWARGGSGPTTWRAAVTHLGRQPGDARARRFPAHVDPSSSSKIPPSDTTARSTSPVRLITRDRECQVWPRRKLIVDRGCQVDPPSMADQEVGPDSRHPEAPMFRYRSVLSLHPPGIGSDKTFWIDLV